MNYRRYVIVNAVGLNLVWMGAVAGAAGGLGWFGPLAMALFAMGHLPFADRQDLRMVLALLPLGFALDSVYAATGMITYASPWPSPSLAPLWILSLWVAFALTLRHSMRWMTERRWLGAVLGGVFGPVSYGVAGEVWGAATFNVATPVWFTAIGVSWFGVMLLCNWLLGREQSQEEQPRSAALELG